MKVRDKAGTESAIGTEIVTGRLTPNAMYRSYIVQRPAPTRLLKAVEGVLDIDITLDHPVRKVWRSFANWNLWMKRYGYVWEPVPAEGENRFVYLGNTGASNTSSYGTKGARIAYVVRKVIPEHFLYLESLPTPVAGKDAVFAGNNVFNLRDVDGRTTISVFMEHTWYSETLSIEALREEARFMSGPAVVFWRDYFVPDLTALMQTGGTAAV